MFGGVGADFGGARDLQPAHDALLFPPFGSRRSPRRAPSAVHGSSASPQPLRKAAPGPSCCSIDLQGVVDRYDGLACGVEHALRNSDSLRLSSISLRMARAEASSSSRW